MGSFGIDFGGRGDETLERCCNPPDDSRPSDFPESPYLYLKEENCDGTELCFTSNPLVADGWKYCVRDAAARLMDELRVEGGQELNYTVEDAMAAQCEVVYYDWLRNPMLVRQPKPEKCSTGVMQASRISKRVLLGVILGVAAFLS
ncbi:hypothetical protein PG996_006730 [Apiospora saccharicola]|uniref:Uncharacterized protein n=1 Tax=Apiospora saccharicola TaxID=335842 RepID=A0ABR1V8U3_9PEZI